MATPTSATHSPQSPAANRRRTWMLRGLILVILLAAAAWAAWYYARGRYFETTDDAYVAGNQVQITPQVAGTVVRIGVDDGDYVEEGQVLVELDRSDADVQLDLAKAQLARTVRQVRGLYSNVNGGMADVAAKQVALDRARADFARRRRLAETGAISSEELAHAREALTTAESALSASKDQLNATRALVDETEVASHPEVQAAAATLRQAYLADVRSTLLAPVSGHVAKRTVQVGSRVQPGTPLMAVVALNEIWVDANFKETQLSEMRIGQPVTLQSDLYGDEVVFRGHIESLGIGTGSAFSVLPAQNATGNWIKIVQRMPVRIAVDADALDAHPLRIGLSMKATVDLHDQDGALLASRPPAEPRYSTAIYDQQLAQADGMIEQIVRQNLAVSGPQAGGGASRAAGGPAPR